MRQTHILREYDPGRGISVSGLAHEYHSGSHVPAHAHGSDQLVYAIHGVMEVSSGQSMWLIPPQFALWIPARTVHWIRMPGAVSMRTLYFRPGLVARPMPGCTVLHLTPLLRELILETVRIGQLRMRHWNECLLRDLTILHLSGASQAPTFVTLPREPRALSIARMILDDPGQSQSLQKLCTRAGASVRTIERIFQKDIGTDFDAWRRQVRMIKAVEMLVSGSSVKEVAYSVGYRQPSAFVEAFRRSFGSTPKVWTASLKERAKGTDGAILIGS